MSLYAVSLAAFAQSNTFPSSGNVGIGTITPTEKLQVVGTMQAEKVKIKFNSSVSGSVFEIGDSVKFANEMNSISGVAIIKDHIFHRFSFNLNSIVNRLNIENVRFVQSSIADFTAKNSIELLEGTLLEPDSGAYISLNIDSNIASCTSSPRTKPLKRERKERPLTLDLYRISPTIVVDNTRVFRSGENGDKLSSVKVYNFMGQEVYSLKNIKNHEVTINLSHLTTGIYIVKAYDADNNVLITSKIIKK